MTQCLKIAQKVAFNIASEASYVYILKVDKKSSKMPKMTKFGEIFKCDNLGNFQTMWVRPE